MNSLPDDARPVRDTDATSTADPADDPAQAEWDRTSELDEAAAADPDLDGAIPAEDGAFGSAADGELVEDADEDLQPESQGEDPLIASIGEDGEGDLAPEDV